MTCTVVSVMPYMLIRRGCASPNRSNHGVSAGGSSASPPKITQRKGSVGQREAPAGVVAALINCRNAEGVWFNTVTSCVQIRSSISSGDRLVRCGTTMARPP